MPTTVAASGPAAFPRQRTEICEDDRDGAAAAVVELQRGEELLTALIEGAGRRTGAADAGGAGRPPPHVDQLAAWYASMTDFGMRPRSLTWCPF